MKKVFLNRTIKFRKESCELFNIIFPNIKIMLSEYIIEENGKASSTSNIIKKLTDTLHLDA